MKRFPWPTIANRADWRGVFTEAEKIAAPKRNFTSGICI